MAKHNTFPPDQTEILRFLKTVQIIDDQIDGELFRNPKNQAELTNYLDTHGKRLWRSLQIISQWDLSKPPNILELGAMPYYFSSLLKYYLPFCKFTGVNVSSSVWPEVTKQPLKSKSVKIAYGRDQTIEDLDIFEFNIERDLYPFQNMYFDYVLCMEVIEHLIYSPTHMLAEAHRVLKPGGQILISTPNAVDLRKTISLILNRPTAFKYSGYSIYGRHNREFTLNELTNLVEQCGFRIIDARLENIISHSHHSRITQFFFTLFNTLTRLPLPYLRHKREYCFVLAESTGNPYFAYPENLYLFSNLYPSN